MAINAALAGAQTALTLVEFNDAKATRVARCLAPHKSLWSGFQQIVASDYHGGGGGDTCWD